MDRVTDLSAALKFVVGRIEEEAIRSGHSMKSNSFLLKNYLVSPTRRSSVPAIQNCPSTLFQATLFTSDSVL